MSDNKEERPVIEVTEESWEEDTGEVDVSELEEAKAAPVEVREEIPIDEELSASLHPVPLPVQSARPTEPGPGAVVSVVSDSEPPPSAVAEFVRFGAAEPPLSLGEHLSRARRIGTGIWYAGVFLWVYLIVGELVVGVGLSEVLGWSAFAGVVVGAFLHGANRIGTLAMRNVAVISIGSVISFVFLFAMLAGSSARSDYQALSFVLLVVALVLIFFGLRYSRGGLPQLPGPRGIRWHRLALWVVFLAHTALVTALFLDAG